MRATERTYDFENRLIEFAVRIIKIAEALLKTPVGRHIAGQIIRSGTSPAANYGEAQRAESRADFIHKIKICLKELRETKVLLMIIKSGNLCKTFAAGKDLTDETDQLISIFVASVKTARRNQKNPSYLNFAKFRYFNIMILFPHIRKSAILTGQCLTFS